MKHWNCYIKTGGVVLDCFFVDQIQRQVHRQTSPDADAVDAPTQIPSSQANPQRPLFPNNDCPSTPKSPVNKPLTGRRSSRPPKPKVIPDFVPPRPIKRAPKVRHSQQEEEENQPQAKKQRKTKLSKRDDETEEEHALRVELHKKDLKARAAARKVAAKKGT